MKTKIIIPALALTLLGTGVFAAHEVQARGCPYMSGNHNGTYMQEVEITDEQSAKAQALVAASQKKTESIKEQLFVKNQELAALQNATNPDVEAVKKVAAEIVALRNQLRTERENLGTELDKALGLPEGTHNLNGKGHNRGYGHGKGYGHGEGRGHGSGHGQGKHY